MTRQQLIIAAAVSVLPECKRATPNAGKAASAAREVACALADSLEEFLEEAATRSITEVQEPSKPTRKKTKAVK